MAALILPHRYRAQARGLVEVDYSNPLSAGLVSAYNMTSAPLRIGNQDATGRYNGRKSSAGRRPYTLHSYHNDGTTEAGLVYTDEGAAWEFGGTYVTKAYNQNHPNAWSGAVTFIIRVLLHSNTADQCIIGHFNDSVTPDYLYGCGIYITGGTLYGVGANNNSRVISATAPDTGKWVTLACVTNTADGKLAINGQVVVGGDLSGALSGYSFAIGCAGHTAAGATSGTAFLDGLVGPALVFNRALSDAELRSISENPYQILRPASDRLWLDVVAGGGGVSGTLAASDAPDAGAFAGALTFTGSLAATDAQDSASLSGTAFAPGFSGALAATEASDSPAFSGALSFVGSITATEPQDQISLTGSTGSGGTLAATESVDTASLAGAFGAASFSGLLAATEATDTLAVSGSVMAPPIIGSLMASDGQDVAVLAGYVPVYGVCAANDPIDYCVLAGAFGVPAGLRRTGASFSALRPPLNTPSALRPGSGAVRFGRNREITEA